MGNKSTLNKSKGILRSPVEFFVPTVLEPKRILKEVRTSLAVQRLRLRAATARGAGAIPDQELRAMPRGGAK